MPTQITPFTTSPSRANPATFSADMDTRLSQENSRITEMNLQSGENNVINANVNAKEASATAQAAASAASAASAATAMNTAYATANFKGAWNSITDFGNSSCEYLGLIYVSKVSPNVNHLPTDTASWTPLTQALPIDETLSHLSTTAATVNADGTLATMTYTGGYKTLYTYTTGNLTKVEYTDTNGTTVLLTETISYTVDGIPLTTRS